MSRTFEKTAILALLLTALVAPIASADEPWAETPEVKSESSFSKMTDSVSSGFSSGFKKLVDSFSFTSTKVKTNDPTSLESEITPGPELYLSLARTHERNQQTQKARKTYEKALEMDPNHLGALLSYAQFLNRLDDLEGALAYYAKAVKAYPENAAVYNDMALFYAEHDMGQKAYRALEEAIRLEPTRSVYRNNMATVLVQLGRNKEAFTHLRAINDEPTAFYNLGYLLQEHGQTEEAIRHFRIAVKKKPTLHEAWIWLENLEDSKQSPPQSQLATRPTIEPRPMIHSRPTTEPFPNMAAKPNPAVMAPTLTEKPTPSILPYASEKAQLTIESPVQEPAHCTNEPGPALESPLSEETSPGTVSISQGTPIMPPVVEKPLPTMAHQPSHFELPNQPKAAVTAEREIAPSWSEPHFDAQPQPSSLAPGPESILPRYPAEETHPARPEPQTEKAIAARPTNPIQNPQAWLRKLPPVEIPSRQIVTGPRRRYNTSVEPSPTAQRLSIAVASNPRASWQPKSVTNLPPTENGLSSEAGNKTGNSSASPLYPLPPVQP